MLSVFSTLVTTWAVQSALQAADLGRDRDLHTPRTIRLCVPGRSMCCVTFLPVTLCMCCVTSLPVGLCVCCITFLQVGLCVCYVTHISPIHQLLFYLLIPPSTGHAPNCRTVSVPSLRLPPQRESIPTPGERQAGKTDRMSGGTGNRTRVLWPHRPMAYHLSYWVTRADCAIKTLLAS